MRIAIGSDHAGFCLKTQIIGEFSKKGYVFDDFGSYDKNPVDYSDIGYRVASSIAQGKFCRGILICATGNGMAVTANKVEGINAAVCNDIYSAKLSSANEDIRIMCVGARVVGPSAAFELVSAWLGLPPRTEYD